jgi:para-aminobenzoate synthetase component 1
MKSGTSETDYSSSIETVLDWIGQGHIYQANYTYPVVARLETNPRTLYRRLRLTSPAPYGAYLQTSKEVAILSSSPEQFLRIDGRRIQTKPIKGTEARHSNPEKDRQLAKSLLESEKDQAELTMIVDLERNDLGRICEFGSVTTHPFPVVESFRSVHHLVATVEGQLRKDVTLRDILAATFPGGSITGAPKIRAMEIIAELETRPRFIYTGALGYLDDRGTAELALTIRTLWTEGDQVHFDVGGGIVADSTTESEWEETHQKAEGMRRAIEPFSQP